MTTRTELQNPEAFGLPSADTLARLAAGYFPEFNPGKCLDAAAAGDVATLSEGAAKAARALGRLSAPGAVDASPWAELARRFSEPGFDAAPAAAEAAPAQPAVPAGVISPRVVPASAAESTAAGAAPAAPAAREQSGDPVIGSKSLSAIRAEFPILSENVNGRPVIWFDNGATTQRPLAVINRISDYYLHENSNVHRAAHELAARSTDAYEGARQAVADFIGAPSKDDVVWMRGTTEGINLVAQAFVRPRLRPGDEILVSELEHHANIVPWQLIAQATGAVIRVIPVDERGDIDLRVLPTLFTRRTKFLTVAQVSNTLGTITPVAEIIALAHRHGVPVLVDGAQSAAHLPVNVTALDADFFVFSGHKIYGPNGIGAVYGRRELWAEASPWQGGGNMIRDVTFERTVYNEAPAKFEAGTGSIADAVGLGATVKWLGGIGMAAVAEREHELTAYALSELARIPGLHIFGSPRARSGVLSFTLDGVPVPAVGEHLNRFGIAVRAGHHCAQPVQRKFGLEGTVRPVLGIYNTEGEVDELVRAVRALV
ncbi:cysteine desulfurase [Sutterella sp.]|uniref:cysteine desulfurase n=1 Tax=Sutterella sp. TaxID=1981025 RepID=UPI0026E10F1A|nr:cysteine desulfurase [Sutterella sp.]MDO5532767.1 cysteine desulfurase [Sutterella sp.]